MFGSEILDVMIGLIVVFLMVSLIASAVREGIEGWMKMRAVFLERGVHSLFNDKDGKNGVTDFYQHPLIKSLLSKDYVYTAKRRHGSGLPTYIPSRNFAVALMDLVARPPGGITVYQGARAGSPFTVEELRASASRFPNEHVRRAMLSAIDSAYGDIRGVQTNLEAWFDSSMDRVSGWYKRRTQLYLFVIGFVLTAAFNVDPIAITRHLWQNKAAREALVSRATVIAQDPEYKTAVRMAAIDSAPQNRAQAKSTRQRYEDLESLRLPIGWKQGSVPTSEEAGSGGIIGWWILTLFGFMTTASAVTLGAPFWFDLLNKMMVIRSTVKPREKSQEEGSEDRKGKSNSGVTSAPPQPPAAPGTTPNAPGPLAPPSQVGSEGTAEQIAAAAFEPRQWAMGTPDEGLL